MGKSHDRRRLDISRLRINGNTMEVAATAKDLGVIIDSDLSFKDQINRVVRTAGYHLKNIAFVKKYLDEKTIKMLVHNHVISKLDYCNSLYYDLPNYTLKKLQYVMNRAARLVKGLPLRERITPALIDLHWLPIKARIVFKICVLTYQALKFGKPEYIRHLLEDFHVDTTLVLRHSAECHRLNEPRCNLKLGFRAFEKSAPRLYNKLPEHVKSSSNVKIFKKKLKTHLFKEAYDIENMCITNEFSC